MSRKRVGMHRLQEMVRLHRLGEPCHEVARKLRMGPNAERKYRKAIQAEGLLVGPPDELPSVEDLKAAVERHHPPVVAQQQRSSIQRWQGEVAKMLERDATPTAIYDTLRSRPQKDFDGSLSAVKRMVARLKKAQPPQPDDVAIPMCFAPGSTAQVDFGYVGRLLDPETGVERKAWVFVMVLGHSRHRFDRVVFDQRAATWIEVHVEAFAFFGAVPKTVVPDNLKAAVIRASFGVDRPDGALNRSYRELAQHYGFQIDPTPPRAPKKKGQVENGVKYVKNNFFKPRSFEDIHDANAQLDAWVLNIAGTRTHGTTGRQPLEMFESAEKPAMLALPQRDYQHIEWKRAKVHRDCRFVFERALYPVPWRFIESEVWVRATPSSLEVYADDERIITHARGVPVPDEVLHRCLPQERRELRRRNPGFWIERADAISEEVGAYIRDVFDSDAVLSKLRVVQAMVVELEKYPTHRAEGACRRASHFGNYTFKGLRNILRNGLDFLALPGVESAPDVCAQSKFRFARSVEELLPEPTEAA